MPSKPIIAVVACLGVLPPTMPAAAQHHDAPDHDVREHLAALIDSWHAAAASADADTYFGMMAADAVYIGTDAGERWTKTEFVEFAQPYFDRGSAWSFTATTRHIYLSEDGEVAWFEELLDTWMGVCSASGVLQKSDEGWMIKHYHLSVTVPNELINEFIDLVKSGTERANEK